MTASGQALPSREPGSARRDVVFAGAVLALAFGLIQKALVGPILLERVQTTLPAASGVIGVMLWAGTVFAPVLFVLVCVVASAGVWSIGAFLEEPAPFRELLNICAVAEVARTIGLTLILSAVRLGWLASDTPTMASLLGGGYGLHESLWMSASRGLLSPPTWVWAISLAVLLRRWGHWTWAGAIVAPIAALIFRVLAIAIRTQHSFLSS